MKTSKLRALAIMMALTAILVSYRIGYHNGYGARGHVMYVGGDVPDTRWVDTKQPTGTPDPYYTPVNRIPSERK